MWSVRWIEQIVSGGNQDWIRSDICDVHASHNDLPFVSFYHKTYCFHPRERTSVQSACSFLVRSLPLIRLKLWYYVKLASYSSYRIPTWECSRMMTEYCGSMSARAVHAHLIKHTRRLESIGKPSPDISKNLGLTCMKRTNQTTEGSNFEAKRSCAVFEDPRGGGGTNQ